MLSCRKRVVWHGYGGIWQVIILSLIKMDPSPTVGGKSDTGGLVMREEYHSPFGRTAKNACIEPCSLCPTPKLSLFIHAKFDNKKTFFIIFPASFRITHLASVRVFLFEESPSRRT